jgi:excinuclease ABC subunit B
MTNAINETNRRRTIQMEYNEKHGITPQTIKKELFDLIKVTASVEDRTNTKLEKDPESMSREEIIKYIKKTEKEMRSAATDLDFEKAAMLRDRIIEAKKCM